MSDKCDFCTDKAAVTMYVAGRQVNYCTLHRREALDLLYKRNNVEFKMEEEIF